MMLIKKYNTLVGGAWAWKWPDDRLRMLTGCLVYVITLNWLLRVKVPIELIS